MEFVLVFLETILGFVPPVEVAAVLVLIPFIVDLLKRVNLLPDGYAGVANLALNAVFWLVLFVAGHYGLNGEAVLVLDAVVKLLPLFTLALSTAFADRIIYEINKFLGIALSRSQFE